MSKSPAKPAAKAAPAAAPDRKVVTFQGVVESDTRAKTRTVVVRFQAKHAKYGKYLRKQTVLQAHDEGNTSKLGDLVEVGPCRPMSKTKTWRVLRVMASKARD
jgi:small subunit ribosomal protein S17